jgi:hypothetical protein
MGLFKKIFGGNALQEAASPAVDGSTGRFYMDIVGESHYQSTLRSVRATAKEWDDDGRAIVVVRVECEPTNPYDPMACRVVTINGRTMGYLSRERARKFHNAIGEVGGAVTCKAVVVKGDAGVIGVWLDLCDPHRIPGASRPKREQRQGVEVIGEMKCQEALRRARERGIVGDDGRVEIGVRLSCDGSGDVLVASMMGEPVGYLAKPVAKRYVPAIERVGGSFDCKAVLHGGESGKWAIGVWLDLCEPQEIQ